MRSALTRCRTSRFRVKWKISGGLSAMRACLPFTRCGKLSSCSSFLPALVRMAWSFLLNARSSMYFISGTSSILLCQIFQR